jgi:hypothetical protein
MRVRLGVFTLLDLFETGSEGGLAMERTLFSDARLSYAQGASAISLVGATIGDV